MISAWLLPVDDYLGIPGVEDATRVAVFKTRTSVSRQIDAVFLGIDRYDFPRVAFHRSDFNRASLGELMNRLGMYPNGILVSRNFLKRSRLLEGQTTKLDISINYGSFEHEFLIVGAYDYFPTAYPEDNEVFVGNLGYLFEQVGDESLHQIWMKTRDDVVPQTIVDSLKDLGIHPIRIRDARALLTLDEERVERIGLYGILSVGFLASTLLASLGLLVYNLCFPSRPLATESASCARSASRRGSSSQWWASNTLASSSSASSGALRLASPPPFSLSPSSASAATRSSLCRPLCVT